MNSVDPTSYLDFYLEPLRPFLARPEVTDIYINRPGEIWVETLGGEIQRFEEPALDDALLWRLVRQIASHSHQGINRRHPLLAANLPDGARVQIAAPPATRGEMAIAIRRHVAASVTLESFGTLQTDALTVPDSFQGLQSILDRRDYPAFLAEVVRRRLNVVISGGTSAGKTTLLNSLLSKIPANERIISIEDTQELRLSHANSVGLIAARGHQGEADVTTNDLLQAALRMRPHRILLGELRGEEAFTFLRAINTGHPGSLTTVHADTPERALVQIAMMSLQAGLEISYADIISLVRGMIDVVVQMDRRRSVRFISAVILPSAIISS